jgi:hypothetical protein
VIAAGPTPAVLVALDARTGAAYIRTADHPPPHVHVASQENGLTWRLLAKRHRIHPLHGPSFLHPAARELLRQDGDVPLLLAAHLRSGVRDYVDIAEVEATSLNSSKPFGESDLVALCGDALVVAEAKSVGSLGKSPQEARRTVTKRLKFAELLRADQLIMATSVPDWAAASVTAIREAASTWPHQTRPPIVRLITGLGSGETRDERLDFASGTRSPWG